MKFLRLLPDQTQLRRLFNYDSTAGVLIHKPRTASDFDPKPKRGTPESYASMWNTQHAGRPVATNQTKNIYASVKIGGQTYALHRVIWKWVHGTDPHYIDHINGLKCDNRIANLRSVDESQNAQNMGRNPRNKTGIPGVFWHKGEQKWAAKIHVRGRTHYLGYYRVFADAVAARKRAERQFNFHRRHGEKRIPHGGEISSGAMATCYRNSSVKAVRR